MGTFAWGWRSSAGSVAVMALAACGGATDVDPSSDSLVTPLQEGEYSLWNAASTPRAPNVDDARAVEVGVRFRADVAGEIRGVRFYKGASNGGVHVAHLWSKRGALLATKAFAGETASGWQTVRFDAPVAIPAGTDLIASYHTDVGHYAGDNDYFTRAFVSGPLRAPADAAGSGNGVYRYGASAFPSNSYRATNYWVDVVFKPASAATSDAGTDAGAGTNVDAGTDADAGAGTNSDAGSSTPPPSNGVGCAAIPSACGYPDATNTGPRPGTTLRRVPQDVTSGPGWAWEASFGRLLATGKGAVLDGLDVTGPVVIDAPNVTLRNSVVTYCDPEGDVVAVRAGNPGNGYDGNGAQILNNRLRCATAGKRSRSAIRDVYGAAQNLVAIANDISGTGNGITIERNGVAADNWIHDLGHLSGDHHSGLSNHGGASNVVFRHNTALLANTPTTGGGGLSGAITIYGDFARAQNVTVSDNLVSGGAYTFYGGINNEDQYGQPIEIHIDQNRLVCGSWVYGPVFRRAGATNTFNGNYCDQDRSPVSP